MIGGLVFLSFSGDDEAVEIEMKFANEASKGASNKVLGDADIDANKNSAKTNPYDIEDNFDKFVSDYRDKIAAGTLRSYYFGDSDDGAMKTGTQNVTIDGDSFTFKFNKSGALKSAGFVGIDDKKLYMAGKQVKADKDDKYSVYKVSFDESGKAIAVNKIDTPKFLKDNSNSDAAKYYLVGSNGTFAKGKSPAKDGNDYKFTVNSNYQITKVTLDN